MTRPYDTVSMAVHDVLDQLAEWGCWTWSACFGCAVVGLVLEFSVEMPLLTRIVGGIALLCGGGGIGVYLAWHRLMQAMDGVMRTHDEPPSSF